MIGNNQFKNSINDIVKTFDNILLEGKIINKDLSRDTFQYRIQFIPSGIEIYAEPLFEFEFKNTKSTGFFKIPTENIYVNIFNSNTETYYFIPQNMYLVSKNTIDDIYNRLENLEKE